jgi:hypothetical protein
MTCSPVIVSKHTHNNVFHVEKLNIDVITKKNRKLTAKKIRRRKGKEKA